MSRACERIGALTVEAAAGRLDESLRAQVLEHAAGCAECADALAFQQRLGQALADAQLGVPPVYFEGVLAEIHRRMPAAPPRQPARRRGRPWLATAAMAALAFAWVGAALSTQRWNPEAPRPAIPARAPIQAVAQAERPDAANLVLVKGYGLVAANSELLKPEVRRELHELGLERLEANAGGPSAIKG